MKRQAREPKTDTTRTWVYMTQSTSRRELVLSQVTTLARFSKRSTVQPASGMDSIHPQGQGPALPRPEGHERSHHGS